MAMRMVSHMLVLFITIAATLATMYLAGSDHNSFLLGAVCGSFATATLISVREALPL